MKSFEEFVESREKMDPSTGKLSDHQWKQAYAAYRSSRARVRKSSSSSSSRSDNKPSGQSRRRASTSSEQTPAVVSDAAFLKQQIRQTSAYGDFRTIVDILAWVAIAVLIINALLKMSLMVEVYATLSALIEGAWGVSYLCFEASDTSADRYSGYCTA